VNAASNYAPLSDRELLGRLIGVRAASRVYQGSLLPLFSGGDAPEYEKCTVARELVRRWLHEEIKRDCLLSAPAAVRDYLRIHFAGRDYEAFVAILVDSQNRLIAIDELFRGSLTQTSVYPREIVKVALARSAAAVIFAHNHPSGVAEPSRADETLTQALKHALSLVDVRVLDHFIVAGANVLSFAERGLI